MNTATTSVTANTGARAVWNRIADRLDCLIVHDILALMVRVAIAAVFWLRAAPRSTAF